MLNWQYDRLIGQLILLQDHAADPTCPCTLGESGEYCTAKHLLAIQEYATETMQMVGDDKIRGFLNDLSIEAREHRDREKQFQCGEPVEFTDLAEWARSRRKFLEPLVYKGSCQIAAKHRISQEPGAPESGVQKGMFGHDIEFHPKGKGRIMQIDMLDHARLQGMKDASGSSCQLLKAHDTDLMPWFDRYDGGDAVFAMEPIADRGRKLDELIKQLREGIKAVWESDNYAEYLKTLSKFHNYSLGNCILIWLQRPDASRVAGFQTWKNLGRYVKKGEKAITILAPCVPSKPKPAETDTEDAGDEPDIIEVAARPMYFKPVSVFDISQTDGKELVDIAYPEMTGEASPSLWQKLIDYAGKENVAIDFSPKPDQNPEIKGTYYPSSKDIWIKPDESKAQQVKTLAHELAHHNSTRAPLFDRSDEETIAESAAFVVCGHFGFDTGIRSFPYVALWAGEEKRLRNNLSAVRAIADKMIDAMEALPRSENNIAKNILKQLGGQKFIAMTGAKHFFSSWDGLSFKLPKGFSRNNINYVKIVLLPSDTYSVEFSSIGPAPKYNKKIISSYDGLYADQLQDIFKTETGLDTMLALHRTAGADDIKAEMDALLDDLSTSRARKLIKYVKRSGNYKGELVDLTPAQFKEITGKAPNAAIINKSKKIPSEYAIDDIATELGFKDDRDLKREVERVYDLKQKIEDTRHRLSLAKAKAKEPPKCSGMIKTVSTCIDPALEGEECKAKFLECDDLTLAAIRHPARWSVHKLKHDSDDPSDKNEIINVRYAGEASREMKDIAGWHREKLTH